MYRKSSVFASGSSAVAARTEADYRQGMIPNTIAMAEDVNAYGSLSDKMNWTMSQELSNLIEAYGITLGSDYVSDPTNAANKMLLKLFQEKLSTVNGLTGVMYNGTTIPVITQTSGGLSIPELKIRFNSTVYYSNTEQDNPVVTISAQTFTLGTGVVDGVKYLYATNNGGLAYQTTPVLGADGATKCFLGSFYVLSGNIQTDSWKYQPWLTVSSVEDRENPTAYTKGGYMTARNSSSLQMGTLEIQAEGMNVDTSRYAPNIKTIQAQSPFYYKPIYPGYNPNNAAIYEIGTTNSSDVGTHLYNTSTNTWVDIKTWASGFNTPKFIVIVPCITPSGQTLMIPAMSTYDSGTGSYAQVFDSQAEAAEAVFGMQYANLDTVASRCIYLGISLVVRVSTTSSVLDLTNPEDFMVVGRVPQALAGFTSAAGQSGGGAGAYIPMKVYEFDTSYQTVTLVNNAVNIISGIGSTDVQVNFPTPTAGIMNQVMIQFPRITNSRGLVFPNDVTWWFDRRPNFQNGYLYEFICDYAYGKWRIGFMVTPGTSN